MSSGRGFAFWRIAAVIALTRAAESLTVYARWDEPVTKASGHVSGDALARYRFGGMPLSNIWKTREEHGVNEPGRG